MLKALLALVCLVASTQAAATFSIAACDEEACGVAVATNNLAVGATVPYARAGVGAVATQFETNPNYGPRGLALLGSGNTPERTLATILAKDGNFEGTSTEFRQVAVVAARGAPAVFTGRQALASPWAGGLIGTNYAIIGNGLVSENVLTAMEKAFRQSTCAPLAMRLLLALEAGQGAGGQSTGSMSAALLVRTNAGGFADLDLRVDAAREPTRELRRLFDLGRSHSAMLQAERAARDDRAQEAHDRLAEALQLGASWDRILRRAARLEMSLHEPDRAACFLAQFAKLNESWGEVEIKDEIYEPLRKNPSELHHPQPNIEGSCFTITPVRTSTRTQQEGGEQRKPDDSSVHAVP